GGCEIWLTERELVDRHPGRLERFRLLRGGDRGGRLNATDSFRDLQGRHDSDRSRGWGDLEKFHWPIDTAFRPIVHAGAQRVKQPGRWKRRISPTLGGDSGFVDAIVPSLA